MGDVLGWAQIPGAGKSKFHLWGTSPKSDMAVLLCTRTTFPKPERFFDDGTLGDELGLEEWDICLKCSRKASWLILQCTLHQKRVTARKCKNCIFCIECEWTEPRTDTEHTHNYT